MKRCKMLDREINRGCLYLGATWEDALNHVLVYPYSDCGIEPVYKKIIKETILDDPEIVFAGYQIYAYGNGRKYVTRIPKSLNEYVRELLDAS